MKTTYEHVARTTLDEKHERSEWGFAPHPNFSMK